MGPVVGIVIGLAVVGIVIYVSYLVEKKRTEAMEAHAQSHGLVFEGKTSQLNDWVRGFKLFNQGHSRVLKNVMRGAKDQAAVAVGDYKYTTGSGKHSQVHNQTICVVRHPGLHVPHFFLRRQVALFDALGKMFGGQDINFDEDPTFSKAFVLQTNGDEQELRRYFNERARSHFTALSKRQVQVEGVGDTLLIHFGKRLDVKDLEALVADAVNTSRLWARS